MGTTLQTEWIRFFASKQLAVLFVLERIFLECNLHHFFVGYDQHRLYIVADHHLFEAVLGNHHHPTLPVEVADEENKNQYS